MGNYSHLMHEEGCELDVEKLKQICDSWELEQLNWIEEADKEWKEQTLGSWINGWKIQGYWYPGFVEFLYACAYSMSGLTEEKSDNHLEMEEEQGFKFFIYFNIQDGKPLVSISCVPMEFIDEDLARPNKPIQTKIE